MIRKKHQKTRLRLRFPSTEYLPTTYTVQRIIPIGETDPLTGDVVPAEIDSGELCVSGFAVPPAKVTVSLGGTVNTGNFQSFKLSVGVSVPCYSEDMPVVFERSIAWVQARMAEHISGVREKTGL